MATTALTAAAISTVAAKQHATIVAGAQDIAFEASDDVNGNHFTSSGKDILFMQNTDVGAQTVTVDLREDSHGRDATIPAYSLAADDIAYMGILDADGYKQADNTVIVTTSDAGVLLAVLRLP